MLFDASTGWGSIPYNADYTGMLRPKGVPFSGPRYAKGVPFSGWMYVKEVPFQGKVHERGTFSEKGM